MERWERCVFVSVSVSVCLCVLFVLCLCCLNLFDIFVRVSVRLLL